MSACDTAPILSHGLKRRPPTHSAHATQGARCPLLRHKRRPRPPLRPQAHAPRFGVFTRASRAGLAIAAPARAPYTVLIDDLLEFVPIASKVEHHAGKALAIAPHCRADCLPLSPVAANARRRITD